LTQHLQGIRFERVEVANQEIGRYRTEGDDVDARDDDQCRRFRSLHDEPKQRDFFGIDIAESGSTSHSKHRTTPATEFLS
jgi:hypothetical protein